MEDAAFKAIVVLNRVARLEPLVDRRECEQILKTATSEWARFELTGVALAELALDVGVIDRPQVEIFELLLRHPACLLYFGEAFL